MVIYFAIPTIMIGEEIIVDKLQNMFPQQYTARLPKKGFEGIGYYPIIKQKFFNSERIQVY